MTIRSWIIRWIGYVLSLLIVANILPDVVIFSDPGLIPLAATILFVLNLTVKPILTFLALPISLLTLGLFSLFINAWMLMLSAALTNGFQVAGFWGAVLAALIIAVVNGVVESIFRIDRY